MQLLRLQSLNISGTAPVHGGGYHYDGPPGEETLVDLFNYVVDVASRTNAFEFSVGPLSSGSNLASLRPEFSMAAEQLPNVIQALKNDNVCECFFGFYEQGANLRLKFTVNENFSVDARCYRLPAEDAAEWIATGATERFVRRANLIAELQSFGRDILAIVSRLCPEMLGHHLLHDWKRRVEIQA